LKRKSQEEAPKTCEFCGGPIGDGVKVKKNRKFCSLACRQRLTHNRAAIRLDMPLSRRFRKRLMFSNPLFFD
jgi:hypothetical protein